jgi:hypothetical protein
MTRRLAFTWLFAWAVVIAGSNPAYIASFNNGLHAQTQSNARSIVVVSDLHMGIGRDASGAWNPTEDFRWATEFSQFLEAIDRNGQSRVDLILNGDTFALADSVLGPCGESSSPQSGCSEREAVARLERILRAHGPEIAALGKFVAAGSNQLTLVPGDEDAALLFPAVSRRVASAISPTRARVDVAGSGHWLSSNSLVWAEHGHQIGPDPYKFAQWPPDLVKSPRVPRTWGERVSGRFFGEFERTYPAVDNVVSLGAGLRYVPIPEDSPDAADLIRYMLLDISWQQFRMELDDGDTQPPIWDLALVRAQGSEFLAASLADDDPVKAIAAKAAADKKLDTVMAQISDEEITAICDYRAAMRRSRRRFEPVVTQFPPRGPAVTECPRTPETRGAIYDYFWRSRDQIYQAHLEDVAKRIPAATRPVAVLVHGHTHLADRAQSGANMISGGLLKIAMEGFSPVRGKTTPVAINGGAWQRTITPVQLLRLADERKVSPADALRALTIEELAPCYSFVQIDSADEPAPAVRYWRQAAGGEWSIGPACGR